jgi:hypothetical protein
VRLAPSRPGALFLAAMAIASCPAARAAHPLQTEDTGTQGAGNLEIENGLQRARVGPATVRAYQPQVSAGLAATLDAIVQPSFVAVRPGVADAPAASGAGDTNADLKWRFAGADPWSCALRAGLELPTAARGLGLSRGQLGEHALLAATWDGAPTQAHFNVGATHQPPAAGRRATTASVSAAVMQSLTERLIVTVDGGWGQSGDAARHGWPGQFLGGAIYTVRPGLDVDIGWLASTHAAPVTREWLAGVTWRFAM